MRIGFVSDSITRDLTGVGRYALNIFNQFTSMGFPPTPIDWRERAELQEITGKTLPAIITIQNPWRRYKNLFWHASLLQKLDKEKTLPDIIFTPSQFVHPIGQIRKPLVYVVHDLSFMTYPECHRRGKKELFQLFFKRTLKKAAHIVCVSHYTKGQLMRYYPSSSNKTSVISEGVDPRFKPVENHGTLGRVREKYRLPEAFLLYVGTIEPRKNIDQLIKAYHIMGERIPLPLYISGKPGWLTDALMVEHHRLKLRDRVRFMGYVPDEDLPALYSLSTAFVYISKEEGFGLPPLEAMSCGTPAIVSRAGALPEVLADAVLYADHASPISIGEKLEAICHDVSLQKEYREKGLARASSYTWEKTANSLLMLFQKIVSSKQRNMGTP